MCNSYLEEDETTKNAKNKPSYIKALINKPIVKPTTNVKSMMKPYTYVATVSKRECMVIADLGTIGHFYKFKVNAWIKGKQMTGYK